MLVVCGIIEHRGRVLIQQRKSTSPYPHYWEFPGGKVNVSEDVTHALARELNEELGITPVEPTLFRELSFEFPHGERAHLMYFRVTAYLGFPSPPEGQNTRWINPRHGLELQLIDPDRTTLKALVGRFGQTEWIGPQGIAVDQSRQKSIQFG